MSIRRVQDLRALAEQHFVFVRVVSGVAAAYVVIFVILLACLPFLASTLILIVVGSASIALGNLLIRGYFDRFNAKHQFRQSLVQRLRIGGLSGFELATFAAEAGVSHSVATESAEMIYGDLYRSALADGKVTSSEAATLDRLGSALALLPVRRAELERSSKESKYRETVLAALDDGVITEGRFVISIATEFRLNSVVNLMRSAVTKDGARTVIELLFNLARLRMCDRLKIGALREKLTD